MFTFLQKQEGVEFPEALRILAERAGIVLERADPRMLDEKNRLLALMDLASQYYHQALLRSPKAAVARSYLSSRGIDPGAIDEWRIGFALPDFESLTTFLVSRKFLANELMQAGLALKKDRGYGLFDRFRNRIMIPIRNVHGAVVGFGGRMLESGDAGAAVGPKYVNSPQTALYDKGRTVFGLDRAKTDIRKIDRAILVEGYMDCFAVAASGMRNVVATSGTALTIDQIRLIKRFTPHFYFSFDTDAAGGQATMRGIELALKEGVDARVIVLPKNADGSALFKDPDECVRKDSRPWANAVDHSVSFVEYCFSQNITDRSRTDSFEKKQTTHRLLDTISLIPDRIEKDHWVKRLALELGLSETILWEELNAQTKRQRTAPITAPTVDQRASDQVFSSPSHDVFLALLSRMPELIETIGTFLTPDLFDDPSPRELYRTIQGLYDSWKEKGEGDFLVLLEAAIPPHIFEAHSFLIERDFSESDRSKRETILLTLSKSLAVEAVKKKMKALQMRMAEAERMLDTAALAQCGAEFSQLQSTLFSLN